MERKSFHCETKAEGEAGEFVALASVFNNVDLVGDKVLPGAFAKSLKRFRDSGDPVPVVFDHQHGDIMAHIGKADPMDVQETDIGLEVRGQLDMENPIAKQAFKLMKDRTLKAWSFAYTVPDGGQKRTKDSNEISEIDLIEVGPTLKGANPEAQLQGVKSALAEAATPHIETLELDGKEVDVTITSPPATAEVEDRPDEEPSQAKSRRQDPLADKTDEWFLDVFGN